MVAHRAGSMVYHSLHDCDRAASDRFRVRATSRCAPARAWADPHASETPFAANSASRGNRFSLLFFRQPSCNVLEKRAAFGPLGCACITKLQPALPEQKRAQDNVPAVLPGHRPRRKDAAADG